MKAMVVLYRDDGEEIGRAVGIAPKSIYWECGKEPIVDNGIKLYGFILRFDWGKYE